MCRQTARSGALERRLRVLPLDGSLPPGQERICTATPFDGTDLGLEVFDCS